MVLETLNFYDFMSWFEGVGGFDIILPFLLIFAVTFAILSQIKVFQKNINTIIAVILAFFLVIQQEAVLLIQGFLPRVSMLILTIIMILLVMGTFGYNFGKSWQGLSAIVALVGVLWALGATAGWDVPLAGWFDDQDVAILLMIGVFVLVIWFIVKEPPQAGKENKLWSDVKGFLGGLGEKAGGGS